MPRISFQNLNRSKKTLLAIGLVLIGLVLLILIAGILNALVGDGEWTLWSSYRYDETGYETGSASIGSKEITAIDVDWIDGEVEVVLCDDAYVSITEVYEGELTEQSLMRYKLSEDGKSLSVKYRASDAFIGFGNGGEDKKLIVRVPRTYIDQLESLTVNSKSADIKIVGVTAKTVEAYSKRGDIELQTPFSVGFTLSFDCKGDLFESNIPNVQNTLGHGDCKNRVVLNAPRGSVRLFTLRDA